MSRSLGFPVLIISLALGGFLFVKQSQTAGPTSSVAQQAEAQASAAASATDFNAALPELQAWLADHGTYAGVTLSPVYGITVVRADATSFCLQSSAEHEIGPGGSPQPGPC
jgi:lipid-binding SYLF domain-containing protein